MFKIIMLAIFQFSHTAQTGSEAHPALYLVGIGLSFPRGKAAGAWN
jgi:hypothetical protein